jgi:hypothetical protein
MLSRTPPFPSIATTSNSDVRSVHTTHAHLGYQIPVAAMSRKDRSPMTTTAARPEPTAAEQPPAVGKPSPPLHALATFELRDLRRELEKAIAFFDRQDPVPAVRGDLQARLDAVLAEQESRQRLARA